MDGWVPKGGSVPPAADGAFERFLTAAIAAIITIMFSWRLLDEMGSDVDKNPKDVDRNEEADRQRRAAVYAAIAASRPVSTTSSTTGVSVGSGRSREISELDIDGEDDRRSRDDNGGLRIGGGGDKAGAGILYNVDTDSRGTYQSPLSSWGPLSSESGYQSLDQPSSSIATNSSENSYDEANPADLMKRFTSAPPSYLPGAWSPLHPDAFARRPGASTFLPPPAKPARSSDPSPSSSSPKLDTREILRRREAAYENRDTWSSPDNSRGEMSDDDDEEMMERRVVDVDDNGTTCFDWPSEDGSGGQDTTGGEEEFVNVSGDSGDDSSIQPRELDSDEELYCCSLLEPIIEEDSDDFLSSSGEDSLKNAAAAMHLHHRQKPHPHHHHHPHPQPARPPPPPPPDDDEEESSSPPPPALPSLPPPPLRHISVDDDDGEVRTPTLQKEFYPTSPSAMANHPSPLEVVEGVFKTESTLIPDTTVDSSDGQSLPYADDESESDESVQTVVRRAGSSGSRSSVSSVSSSVNGSLESSPLHVPRVSTAQQQQQQYLQQLPTLSSNPVDMYASGGLGGGEDSERVRSAFESSMERLLLRVKQEKVSALPTRAEDSALRDGGRGFPEESRDAVSAGGNEGERSTTDSEQERSVGRDSKSSSDDETFEETIVYDIPNAPFPTQVCNNRDELEGQGNEVMSRDVVSLQVAPLSTQPPPPPQQPRPQALDAASQNPFRPGMIIDRSPNVTAPTPLAETGGDRSIGINRDTVDIGMARSKQLPLFGSNVSNTHVVNDADSASGCDNSDNAETCSETESSSAERGANTDEKANSLEDKEKAEHDDNERDIDSAPVGKSKFSPAIQSFLTEFEDEPFSRRFGRRDRSPDQSSEDEPYARRPGRRDESPDESPESRYEREPYARRTGQRNRSPDRSFENRYDNEPYARRTGQRDRSPDQTSESRYEREPYAKRTGQRDRSPDRSFEDRYDSEPSYHGRTGQRDRSPDQTSESRYEREPYAKRTGQRDRSPDRSFENRYDSEPSYPGRTGQRDRSPDQTPESRYEREPYARRTGQRDRSPDQAPESRYEREPYARRTGQRDRSPDQTPESRYEREPYAKRTGLRDRSPDQTPESRSPDRSFEDRYEREPYAKRTGQRDRSPDRSFENRYDNEPYARRTGQRDPESRYEREPYARRTGQRDRSPEESEPYSRRKDRRDRSPEPEFERKHADSLRTQPQTDTRTDRNPSVKTRGVKNIDREPVRSVTVPSRTEPFLTKLEEPFSRRLGSSRGSRLVEAKNADSSGRRPPIAKADTIDSDEEKQPQRSEPKTLKADDKYPENSESESKSESESEEEDQSSEESEESGPEEKPEVKETTPRQEERKKPDPLLAEFEEEPFSRRRVGGGKFSAPRETNLDDVMPPARSVSPARKDDFFDKNRPSLSAKKVDPYLDELEEEPFVRRTGSRASDRTSLRSDSDFDRSARSNDLDRLDTDSLKKGSDTNRSVSNKSDTASIDSFLTELEEEPFARRLGRRRRSPDRKESPARSARSTQPPPPPPLVCADTRKDAREVVEPPTVSKPLLASSPPPDDSRTSIAKVPDSPSVSLPPSFSSSRGYVSSTPQKPTTRQEDADNFLPVSESPTISMPPLIETGPEAVLCYSSTVSVTFTGAEGIRHADSAQGPVTSGPFADATESSAVEPMPTGYTISRCVSETSRSERRILVVDKPMYPDFETLINSVPYTSETVPRDFEDGREPSEDMDDYSAFVLDLRRPVSGSDFGDVIPTPRATIATSATPPLTDAQILSGNLVPPPDTDVFSYPPSHPNILPAVSSVSRNMGTYYSDPDSQADREDKNYKAEASSEGVLDTSFDIDSTTAREKMDRDFDFLRKGAPGTPRSTDGVRRMDDDERMSSEDADDEFDKEREAHSGVRRRRRRKDDSGDRVNDRKRRRNNRRNRQNEDSDEELSDRRTEPADDKVGGDKGRQGRPGDQRRSPRDETRDTARDRNRAPLMETTNRPYDRKDIPGNAVNNRSPRPATDYRSSEQASDVMTKTDTTDTLTPAPTAVVDEGPPILFFQPAALIHAVPPFTYSEPAKTQPPKPPSDQKEQYRPSAELSVPQKKEDVVGKIDTREDKPATLIQAGPSVAYSPPTKTQPPNLPGDQKELYRPSAELSAPQKKQDFFDKRDRREDTPATLIQASPTVSYSTQTKTQPQIPPGSQRDQYRPGTELFTPKKKEHPGDESDRREDQKTDDVGRKLDTEHAGGEFRLEPSPQAVFVTQAPERFLPPQQAPHPKPRQSSLSRPTPMPRSKSLGDNIGTPTSLETAIDDDDEDVFQRGHSSDDSHSSLEDDDDGDEELTFTKKKSAPRQLMEPKRPRSLKEIRRSMQRPNPRPMITPFTLPDNMVLPSRLKIMASRKNFLSSDNLDSKSTTPSFQEQFNAHKLSQAQTSTPAKERLYKSPNRRIRAYSTSQDQLEKLNYMLNYSRHSESSFDRALVDHLHENCILTPQGRRNILDKTLSIENLQIDLPQHLRRFGSVTSLVETNIDTGETQETSFFPETNLDIFDSLFQQLHQPLQRSASMSDMIVSEPGATAEGQGHDDSSLDRSFHGLRMSLPPSQTHKSTGKGRFAYRKYQKSKSLCTLETNLDDVGEEGGSVGVDGEMKRVPSVHELRVTKSLQKLNLPDWYKQSSLSKSSSCLLKYGSNSTMNSFSFSPSLLSSPCASTAPPAPNVVIKTRVVPPTNPRLLRSSPGSGALSPTGPGGLSSGSYGDRKSGQTPVKLPSDKLRDKEKNKNLMPIPIVPFAQIRAMFEKKDRGKGAAGVKGKPQPHEQDTKTAEPARITVVTDNPKEEVMTRHGILKTSAVPTISISSEGDTGRGHVEPRPVKTTLYGAQQQQQPPPAETAPTVVVEDPHTPTISLPAQSQPRIVQPPAAQNAHRATNGVSGDDSMGVGSRTVSPAGDVRNVSPAVQETRTLTSSLATERRPQPPATLGSSSADRNLKTSKDASLKDQKSPTATSKDPKQQFSPTRSLRQFFGGGKSKDKSGSGDSKKGDSSGSGGSKKGDSSSGGGGSLDSSFSSGDGVYEREPRRLVSDLSRRYDAQPKPSDEEFGRRSGAGGSDRGGRPGGDSSFSSEGGVSPTRTESVPWKGHEKPQPTSTFPASTTSRSPHHTSSTTMKPGYINYARQSSTDSDQPPFVRIHEEPRSSRFRAPEPSQPGSGSRFASSDVREPSKFQRHTPGAGTSFERPRSTAENGDHDGEAAKPETTSGGGVKAASDKKPLQETTV